MIKKIHKTPEQWKKILTPDQFSVMREKSTERPFSCGLNNSKEKGTYFCAACDLPLFKSNGKFDSGSGWPSFYEPLSIDHLTFKDDDAFLMQRTEVLCARCNSHLGHVFNDGPLPTGKRFCINGIALKFRKEE